MVWSLHHPRMKNLHGWSRSYRFVKMCYLGALVSMSRLNFNLCSKNNHPYIDKEYMDFQEGRSLGWLIPLGPPKSHEWMASWIFIRYHLNCRPIHPSWKKTKFQSLIETWICHVKVLWMINIFASSTNEHIELSTWLKGFIA